MTDFEIKDNFYLNGEPFQIISGSIHYFRVVPEYWRDRLEKLKNMGCNTVETYIPWNFHEPKKGEFLWDGQHDVCRFIEIAQELGLYIIIRPAPFICAEWEWGGLPAWLLAEADMKVRCSYQPYLDHVREYYQVLIPKLLPYQIDKGGKIILMQIENEYGYYGDDKSYLKWLADLMRSLGVSVPFVTSDGPWGAAFKTGQMDGALPTGNFGSNCEKQFKVMAPQIEGGKNRPLMCMEFWAGWFDAWGNKFKMRSVLKLNKKDYEYTIKNGHNINIYMFHGGTNFGFMNGSNYYGKLTPDTTSYDYDAPLSEDGRMTKKYQAFREILKKYRDVPDVKLSTRIERRSYGQVRWIECADLFENLDVMCAGTASGMIKSLYPLSMEQAGQNTGYVLYRTKLAADEKAGSVMFKKCADRLQIFADSKKVVTAFDKEICSEGHGVWPFNYKEGKEWKFPCGSGAQLDFLVENMGRVNFGHRLMDQKKGITDDVLINGHTHFGWEIFTLPLDESQLAALCQKGSWQPDCEKSENPAFFKFEFEADFEDGTYTDTYLDFKGWGKGCAWVNGFNIGRFWEIGPQKRLYVPGPLLKKGKNEIILFETEGKRQTSITLTDRI
ncbi:MAG: beta-galactosidase [Treponema sp.]|nr:beta-galactosidase [Treponema sp.]